MSTGFEELEVDIPEQGQAQPPVSALDDDLFASEDEEDQQQPQPQEPVQHHASAEPPRALSQEERRANLKALTESRKEQDEKSGNKKKKSKKGGEEGSEGKKRKKKRSKEEGGRAQRRKREDGTAPQGGGKAGRGEDLEDEEEVSDDSEVEHERDTGFIDDAAATKDDEHIGSDIGDDFEDPANQEPPPEALEAEELQFGKNKKKKKAQESDSQMQHVVDNMVSMMEGMAEEDMEDHANGKPAINKLRKLAEVENFMCQRKYHEMFIHAGGLGVLKAWLEPYQDGTLPNVRVRQTVLRACKALPIDTGREDMRENLKKSQLGSRIMFLAKCHDETQANKREAIELVQHWSRPIFFDPEHEAEKRRARENALKKARQQGLEQQRRMEDARADEAAREAKAKLGQPGFRWRAARPAASKLDYVVEPQHDPVLQAMASQGSRGSKDENRFQKKMNEVQRRQKGSTARAAQPSIEGRGILM